MKNIKIEQLLPTNFRQDTPSGIFTQTFIQNTFNKMVSVNGTRHYAGNVGETDSTKRITHSSLEQDVNTLSPAFTVTVGAEEKLYDFPDIVQKLINSGCTRQQIAGWFNEVPFVFALPINYDKFINFTNYFWVVPANFSQTSHLRWNAKLLPEYFVIANQTNIHTDAALASGTINDWQFSNFWKHVDDLTPAELSTAVPASCPIVEYDSVIQLNSAYVVDNTNAIAPLSTISAGTQTLASTRPCDMSTLNAVSFVQRKTFRNQRPLFDLYECDGTHSGYVSSIIQFEELNTNPLNSETNSRISFYNDSVIVLLKLLIGEQQLFFKHNGELMCQWIRGIASETPQVVSNADYLFDSEVITTPAQFKNNLTKENRSEFLFSDLIVPFSDVVGAQPNIIGSAFGNNNYRHLTSINKALGASIKFFDSNTALFVSILINDKFCIPSLLEYAKNSQRAAEASASAFFDKNVSLILSTDDLDVTNQQGVINVLIEQLNANRASDVILKRSFFDSDVGISNWPSSLAKLGIISAVTPSVRFVPELNSYKIVAHDGHLIDMMTYDDLAKLRNMVLASTDANLKRGVINETQPSPSFKGQLWLKESTREIFSFNVDYYGNTRPTVLTTGTKYWYETTSGQIYEYNSSTAPQWILSSATISSFWEKIDIVALRNMFILKIEQILFNHCFIPGKLSSFDNVSNIAEIQYRRLASTYELDADMTFDASNSFTWNFKNSGIISNSPAYWADVYTQYFAGFSGVVSTPHPCAEPWKLLGHSVKPANWDAQYAHPYAWLFDLTFSGGVWSDFSAAVYVDSSVTNLSGLQIIDGYQLSSGQLILRNANNQLQLLRASAGAWSVHSASIPVNTPVFIMNGSLRANTLWINTGSSVAQVRKWLPAMWTAIKQAHPGMKLLSNIESDTILPPVLTTPAASHIQAEALDVAGSSPVVASNTIKDNFNFSDNSLVKHLWFNSLDYLYDQCIIAFKTYGLQFIEDCWGTNTYKSSSGFSLNPLTGGLVDKKYNRLHGGSVLRTNVPSSNNFEIVSSSDVTVIANRAVNGNMMWRVSIGNTYAGEIPDDGISHVLSGCNVKIKKDGCLFCVGDKAVFSNNEIVFTPCMSNQLNGIGVYLTYQMRSEFSDVNASSTVNHFKNWKHKLQYRVNGLINDEPITVNTSTTNVPQHLGFEVLLHEQQNKQSFWIHSFRISVVEKTPKNIGGSYFSTERYTGGGDTIPNEDGSTWVFKIQNFKRDYPVVAYYEFANDDNYDGFYEMNGVSTVLWKHRKTKTTLKTAILPLRITGIQNVIDFINGHKAYLVDQGLSEIPDMLDFDETYEQNVTWDHHINRFVSSVYAGVAIGDGIIINPFASNLTVTTPIGLLSNIDSDFINEQNEACFDVDGSSIPNSELTVIRGDDRATVMSNTMMFGAHLNITEFDHSVVLNQSWGDSTGFRSLNKIYDTFYGHYPSSLFLEFSGAFTDKKPTLDGFYLEAGKFKPNITTNIFRVERAYHDHLGFASSEFSKSAFALFGYNETADYFKQLTGSQISRFNFWKALIQNKGTDFSLKSLVNSCSITGINVDEVWAIKKATYGDNRQKTFLEMKINPEDILQHSINYQFTNIDDPISSPIRSFTQVLNTDDQRWLSVDHLHRYVNISAAPQSETIVIPIHVQTPYFVQLKNVYYIQNENDDEYDNITGVNPSVSGDGITASFVNSRVIRVDEISSDNRTLVVSGFTWSTPSQHAPLEIRDIKTNATMFTLPLWHPVLGIHNGLGASKITYKQRHDPALYSYVPTTGDDYSFNISKSWATEKVGSVWWNTRNLSYIPYDDPVIFGNQQTRSSRWGNLAEWSAINVYEWIESPVHPSKYANLVIESLNSTSSSHSGEVALSDLYASDRKLYATPIAWSYSVNGIQDAHPTFISKMNVSLFLVDNILIADTNTLDDLGLIPGRYFSQWESMSKKPIGLARIGNQYHYYLGSRDSGGISTPLIPPVSSISLTGSGVSFTVIEDVNIIIDDMDKLSKYVGGFTLSAISLNEDFSDCILRMTHDNGDSVDIELADWYTNPTHPNTEKIIRIPLFGLNIVISRLQSDDVCTSLEQSFIIAKSLPDLYIREGVELDVTLDFTVDTFNNDTYSSEYINANWVAYDIPTQDDLDAEVLGREKYKAYRGERVEIDVTPQNIAFYIAQPALTYGLETFKMYETEWTTWIKQDDEFFTMISDGINEVVFDLGGVVDSSRALIYVNGIQLSPIDYTVYPSSISINSVYKEGDICTLRYTRYSPTAEELEFDPSVLDSSKFIRRFKIDYHYTSFTNRNANGVETDETYYFWVKNRTHSIKNKSGDINISNVTDLLLNNDSEPYVFLERMISDDVGVRFDSIAIRNLNPVDNMKLRLCFDSTLRDDDRDMTLKNVHTEWQLFDKMSSEKIPFKYWRKIIDSVTGIDSKTNSTIPSIIRVDYDEKNGSKEKYGFGNDQIILDSDILKTVISQTLLNTSLTIDVAGETFPHQIASIDYSSSDTWFNDPETFLMQVWDNSTPAQCNEIMQNIVYEMLVNNISQDDVFRTSFMRLKLEISI